MFTLFAVIDPIGTVPVFIAVAHKFDKKEKTHIAFKAFIVALLVLGFFALAGQGLLEYLDIPLPAFQIAGGIILFLFALTMIFGESKQDDEKEMIDKKKDVAIFPLAMPSIASPGAIMAVVLLTDNHRFELSDQFVTIGIMSLVLIITFLFMYLAAFIHRVIGDSGAMIVSRVMGLLISALAMSYILEGLSTYFI